MASTRKSTGEAGVAALEKAVRGDVLRPGDAGYEESRTVWNAMIDRRPALVVRPVDAADVARAVDYAREAELPVSAKGGGHNIAGNAVVDGGVTIDFLRMKDVRVDTEARVARVEAGATLGDMDRATQAHGFAAPGGVVSTTGVAGLTLGGGLGWLARKYGLAADNLRSVEIVTADGEVTTASESENADLFWGIRGGSGNFGVVTAFEFELHEVGPDVLFGPIAYGYEDAPAVLRNYREFAREAPRECCVWAISLTAPPLPFLPEERHGTKMLFIAAFYAGDFETGEEVLAPLREFGSPVADAVGRMPYLAVQSMFDELSGPGMRNYWSSQNYRELTDEALDVLVEYAERMPTPESSLYVHHLGGAINDVPPDSTAYPHRDALFAVSPGARWDDPALDDECVAWTRACGDALATHATGGVYVNFVSEAEGSGRAAYRGNYERLAELKAKYDPTNRFRANQNVAPAA